MRSGIQSIVNQQNSSTLLASARSGSSEPSLYEFTSGIRHDALLCDEEVKVQVAWSKALHNCGILSNEEVIQATELLDRALAAMKNGTFAWRIEDEDIHMNIERFITEHAGSLGKKIHLGRSRNDLIATTLRLWVSKRCQELIGALQKYVGILKALAAENQDILIPGQTHMQSGQPITLAHVLLAYTEQIKRCMRFFEHVAFESMHALPLGAAALAGTTLKVNLQQLAEELGFQRACENSYDAVGDRDFMLLFLDALALLMTGLARQSNDVIYWASTGVGIALLPKDWSTGSSIMPNKRNPDVPELVRARAARTMGKAAAAKTLAHALCSSYASDFHELKKDCIDAAGDVGHSLAVFSSFMSELKFNSSACTALLKKGHILATEVANLFVEVSSQVSPLSAKGEASCKMEFRDAYKLTARLVEIAESRQLQIHELDFSEIKPLLPHDQIAPMQEKWNTLSFSNAVAARNSSGGTALPQVQQRLR